MQEINYVDEKPGITSRDGSKPQADGARMRQWLWQAKVTDAFWKFATLFSFTINLVLVIGLAILATLLFDIKNSIAQPLVGGLYGSFVQMDNSRIVSTIQVNDKVHARFDLPLSQMTVVTLTQDTLITGARVNIQGGVLSLTNAPTTILLPAGTALPVQLNLAVPVDQDIPVNLLVPVNIPLNQTELHTPFSRLRNLFFPYASALDKLPPNWETFICQAADVFCLFSAP